MTAPRQAPQQRTSPTPTPDKGHRSGRTRTSRSLRPDRSPRTSAGGPEQRGSTLTTRCSGRSGPQRWRRALGGPRGAINYSFGCFENRRGRDGLRLPEQSLRVRAGPGSCLPRRLWELEVVHPTRTPRCPTGRRRCSASTCGSTPTTLSTRTARPDYVDAWWNVVNWDEVAKRYAAASSGRLASGKLAPVGSPRAFGGTRDIARSASAVIVRRGFTPRLAGTALPSQTSRFR